MKKTTEGRLFNLIQKSLQMKDRYLQEGKLTRNMVLYEKTVIDNINIIDENINYGSHQEFITKAEYDVKEIHTLEESEIVKQADYCEVCEEIAKEYSLQRPQVEFWIRNIIWRFLCQLENPTDEQINETIELLTIEIEKPPKFWQATIFFKGAFLEQDAPLKINEEVTLRKIKKEDMEIEERLGMGGVLPPPQYTSLVLELNKQFQNDMEVHNYIEIITNSLKLFRLGTIHHVRYQLHTKALFGSGRISHPNTSAASNYKYKILLSDKAKLAKIINILVSKNEKKSILGTPDTKNPLWIALKRYNNALYKSDSDEEKVSNFVSCLEALCSTDNVELAHKLSQRVSLLLSHYKYEPKSVFSEIKKAYEIRSTYSHGSYVDPAKHKNLNALTIKLANYTRICLLISIQLIGVLEKKQMISMIDEGLLDKKVLKKFLELLKENCEKFE